MDETADIYYVDTRNATNDHRTGGSGSRPAWQPAPPSRTVYVPAGAMRPMAPQVIYAQPAQPALATFFGKLPPGQVIELVAGLFAMLQPLPASPVATRDAATDIGNLILYQGAIAQHAKRDEQVRTLGGLVGKVLG